MAEAIFKMFPISFRLVSSCACGFVVLRRRGSEELRFHAFRSWEAVTAVVPFCAEPRAHPYFELA